MLISDAHEWINEIPTVPIYYLAKPQPRERAWKNQRGKKTLNKYQRGQQFYAASSVELVLCVSTLNATCIKVQEPLVIRRLSKDGVQDTCSHYSFLQGV